MVLADGMIGQMMEPVEFRVPRPADCRPRTGPRPGAQRPPAGVINSLYLDPDELRTMSARFTRSMRRWSATRSRYELYNCDRPTVVIVAYGTTARVCASAIEKMPPPGPARRPAPPDHALSVPGRGKVLVLGRKAGSGRGDEHGADAGRREDRRGAGEPISFYGRTGGIVPTPEEIVEAVKPGCGKCRKSNVERGARNLGRR